MRGVRVDYVQKTGDELTVRYTPTVGGVMPPTPQGAVLIFRKEEFVQELSLEESLTEEEMIAMVIRTWIASTRPPLVGKGIEVTGDVVSQKVW